MVIRGMKAKCRSEDMLCLAASYLQLLTLQICIVNLELSVLSDYLSNKQIESLFTHYGVPFSMVLG